MDICVSYLFYRPTRRARDILVVKNVVIYNMGERRTLDWMGADHVSRPRYVACANECSFPKFGVRTVLELSIFRSLLG